MKVIESNCETGEVTERDIKPEEIEQILASVPVEIPVETA
jgi:hypothetical protein